MKNKVLQVTGWQQSNTTDGGALVTRKLVLSGSTVLLAGDMDVDDFLILCAAQIFIFVL